MSFVIQLINLPGGHIEGIPVEETLLALGPVLLLTAGVALAMVRGRLRRVRPQEGRLRRVRPRAVPARFRRSARRDRRAADASPMRTQNVDAT